MINRIEIDGIDKTGKDLLCGYIDRLSNRRYVVHSRGLLSMIAYNQIYNRGYDYSQEIENNKDTLIIMLTAELEDLEVRHKLSNEPKIDIERDRIVFNNLAWELKDKGLQVLVYNTSNKTPYNIAKEVLQYLKEMK